MEHDIADLIDFRANADGSVAVVPKGQCACTVGRCNPLDNEGCYCLITGYPIPVGYFSGSEGEGR